MVEQAASIISEINQIRVQYVKEVGSGRRAWPRSIKERVAELEDLGLTAKSVAVGTGISYATIVLWRHKRRKKSRAFHEVRVKKQSAIAAPKSDALAISKSPSVTMANFEIPPIRPPGLILRTPSGFVIEGLDETSVVTLVARFIQGGLHAT
jgi:hypothetical protein